MLCIRMRRTGSKKRPFFRVVVSEARSKKEGEFIEVLGFYNPRTKETRLNTEAIRQRLAQGAQPTESVLTLLERGGLFRRTLGRGLGTGSELH